MERYELHHVCYSRHLWVAQESTKRLRSVSGLLVHLDHARHLELHRGAEIVPVPGFRMGERIEREFSPVRKDPVRTVENLIQAIEVANDRPTVPELDRYLGSLLIDNLFYQLDFIQGFQNGRAL